MSPAIPSSLNVRRPAAEGYGALLIYGADEGEDIYLQLAPSSAQPIRRVTSQPETSTPAWSANPEDFRSGSGRYFSRSGFSGGEGLDRAHRADGQPDDAKRFWASQNIHIVVPHPGDPEEFYLAPEVGVIAGTGTPATPYAVMIPDSRRVYWADGSDVKYCDDLLAVTPTVNSEDPEAGGVATTVAGLGAAGGVLYAALGAEGIHTRSTAGVWSHWSDLAATALWTVKGRVLAAVDNALYDTGEAATSTLLKTLASGVTWLDVCDAGHLILAAASDGKVYAFSDESGSLLLRAETPMRVGEVCYSLGFADGLIFLGVGEATTAGGKIGRVYVAQASGNRLVGSRLVREWGDAASATNHTPAGLTTTRDEVLIPVLEDDGKNAVWSYLLATAGLYCRTYYAAGTSRPRKVFDIDGRVVLFRDGANTIRELTTFAASGWLISPYADWYSAAQKAIVGLRLDNVAIPAAGAQIDLYYSTDPAALLDENHATWTLADTLTYTGDQTLAEEIPLTEVIGRGVAVMVKLTRSTDGASSPQVRSFSSRSFEDLEDVTLELPVNVSDVVERPGKMPLHVPGRGSVLYEALRDREGQPAEVRLLRTGERIKGRVEQLSMAQPVVTPRGTSLLVAALVVRGVKV